MDGHDELARRFEAHRGRLRAVAHRMLGSFDEAEDAVQEAWLRLSRTGDEDIDNLAGWLTTVVSRVCLDMLRSRSSRREEPYGQALPVPHAVGADTPEEAALLGDSVGLALLVVLDRLGPAERVAFVLHDLFGVPFDRIARVVDRSRPAAKKLASRAREKVRGTPVLPGAELDRQRRVVEAFLASARGGDLAGLLDVLAPDVVRRADPAALPPGVAAELRGARAVAEGTVALRERSRFAATALVDGRVGVVVAPHGRLLFALTVTVEGERITAYEVVAAPARLDRLELGVLDLGVLDLGVLDLGVLDLGSCGPDADTLGAGIPGRDADSPDVGIAGRDADTPDVSIPGPDADTANAGDPPRVSPRSGTP